MKPLTHAEMVRMLIARAATEPSSELNIGPQERVRRRLGLSRTAMHNLLRYGKNLTKASLIARLHHEMQPVFAEPGSERYRDRIAEIRVALGDGRSLPNLAMMDQFLLEPAFHVWAAQALDTSSPDADRLLQGRLAHRVMYDWLKHATRRVGTTGLFTITDAEVAARGIEVVNAMVKIVSNHRQAPAGFFETGNDLARRNGYRMFRVTLAADHLGWMSHKPGVTLEERVSILSAAYKRGVHEDIAWVATIQPDEIAWLYNAWSMAIHAGDWLGSVKLAGQLFTRWPKILTTCVSGLKPVTDDIDMWPGIAAILQYSDVDDALDALRSQLRGGDAVMEKMMRAIPRVQAAVAADASYIQAYEAAAEGEMK